MGKKNARKKASQAAARAALLSAEKVEISKRRTKVGGGADEGEKCKILETANLQNGNSGIPQCSQEPKHIYDGRANGNAHRMNSPIEIHSSNVAFSSGLQGETQFGQSALVISGTVDKNIPISVGVVKSLPGITPTSKGSSAATQLNPRRRVEESSSCWIKQKLQLLLSGWKERLKKLSSMVKTLIRRFFRSMRY